jgi:hypothetical protein
VARNKRLSRERLRDRGLPVPPFATVDLSSDPGAAAAGVTFPSVVKPLELSGSRGVMRVDSPADLEAAFCRLRALLQAPDLRAERAGHRNLALVEGFIEGREFALEAVMDEGALHVLAMFDKPDPLDGPFFEETIYVAPTGEPPARASAITDAVARAARAYDLRHGPIHAECRVAPDGRVFVLEIAARPIGGLCARALRFRDQAGEGRPLISLEELLLRHALGEATTRWEREATASGVMMIPIPRRGLFRGAAGLDEARSVPGVDEVRITAKPDQLLLPLPEGASYLGFIFARASDAPAVVHALRAAHARLTFTIDTEVPVLQSRHG